MNKANKIKTLWIVIIGLVLTIAGVITGLVSAIAGIDLTLLAIFGGFTLYLILSLLSRSQVLSYSPSGQGEQRNKFKQASFWMVIMGLVLAIAGVITGLVLATVGINLKLLAIFGGFPLYFLLIIVTRDRGAYPVNGSTGTAWLRRRRDSHCINPGTGLPMVGGGGVDVGGNPFGSSFPSYSTLHGNSSNSDSHGCYNNSHGYNQD